MMPADQKQADAHEKVQSMLPWYVNGTLNHREREKVRTHLDHCNDCRAEAELHERIAAQVRLGRRVHPAPLASLDKLMARVEAHEASPIRRSWRQVGRWFKGRPLEHALIAQAATIFVLVLMLAWLVIRPEPPAQYRTLGTPPVLPTEAGQYLRLVPHVSLTAAEVQGLVRQVDGKIVHGPTAEGVYIIELDLQAGGERAPGEIAAWLNTQPGVKLAVPIGGVEPP